MEIRNDIAIDKMLQQQEQDNVEFINMPVSKNNSQEVYNIDVANKCTMTEVFKCEHKSCIYLKRFINSKLYKVEFNIDVKVMDILDYYNLDDLLFISLSVRPDVLVDD